jgi:hypothetical protein
MGTYIPSLGGLRREERPTRRTETAVPGERGHKTKRRRRRSEGIEERGPSESNPVGGRRTKLNYEEVTVYVDLCRPSTSDFGGRDPGRDAMSMERAVIASMDC